MNIKTGKNNAKCGKLGSWKMRHRQNSKTKLAVCRIGEVLEGKAFLFAVARFYRVANFIFTFFKKGLTNARDLAIIVRHSKYGAMAKW